jgi:predicted TIM-barrel fold metal-dependent hydrolase
METLHGLFDYASRHGLPVLIHTGHNKTDRADRFERFISEYQNTKCVLALLILL